MKKTIRKVLLSVLFLIGFTIYSVAQNCTPVSQAERNALIDLYNATSGTQWTNNTNWNTTALVCDWYGVTVSNGTVTGIQLTANNLEGELPSTIKALSNLKLLRLGQNQLSGSLPIEISELNELHTLVLDRNKLEGIIPKELGRLRKLVVLYLYDNDFTGEIPEELMSLQELKFLYLHKNKLTGSIPTSISNLRKLKRLLLYTNQLSGNIPTTIGNLLELEQLYLNSNQLNGQIPSSIGNLSKLTHLVLYSNAFIGAIPESLTSLSQLQYCFLHVNRLSGIIPEKLFDLQYLKQLMLHSNQLSGSIPENIENLQQLTKLYLSANKFTGTLPTGLSKLTQLEYLYLHNNNFSGDIPDFTGFQNLDYLTLAQNNFNFSALEQSHSTYQSTLRFYSYTPQKELDKEENAYLEFGNDLTLTTTANSSNNSYQWYKNGVAIQGATQREYLIRKGDRNDLGVYHVTVKNNQVGGVTLVRHSINVRESAGVNNFCLSDWVDDFISVADLSPQGANIEWYLEETGGDPLPNDYDIEDAVIDDSYTFWWQNTSGGTRTAATVFINANTPDGDEEQYFNGAANPAPTINDIFVLNNGNDVYWFDAPVGGNLLSNNLLLQDGATYYASSCNDLKDVRNCPCLLEVTVYLGVLPPRGESIQYLCAGSKIGELVVDANPGNELVWYTAPTEGSPIDPSTLIVNGNTYYVAQLDPSGAESGERLAITAYLISSETPTVESPQTFYLYNTPTVANLLALGSDEIKWFSQANGGYQYASNEELVDGLIYYAEQQAGECPSDRVPVQVIVSDEPAPGLLGCDLFKPQVGDQFVISAWVNERAVTAEVAEEIEFNNSEASEAFTGLLNHLLNRLRSTDKDLRDFPEEYIPEFVGDEEQFNLESILPFLKDITVPEKILTVYSFNELFDSYGRTIGFSFYLTESELYQFVYKSPEIRRLVQHYNNEELQVGPDRYPILDNLDSLSLEFTNVSVNATGAFVIESNFDQTASPAYAELNTLGYDSDHGVNPEATFYNYNEIANQQVMNYEFGKIKIEFKDPEGILMSEETVDLVPQGDIIDDWQKVTSDFVIPVNAGQMILSLVNGSDSRICYFDDLRILPFEGNMKSFVYHPETQRLMAELDENNYATFYEYDKEGGLVRVKKETERGTFTIQETRSGNTK